jgi:hypothetical protein
MVENYHAFGSSLQVIDEWKRKFPNLKPPTAQTILNNVKKFKKNGSIHELPRPNRKINPMMEKAKNDITDLISENPKLSIRKLSCATGISYGSVINFLKEDLHLKPYKEHIYHKLEATDNAKRLKFAEWVLSLPIEAILKFSCSDEAWFYLTMPVNKQNDRYWADSMPIVGVY